MSLYKRIHHPERPFIVHIVMGVESKKLAYKLNRNKTKIKSIPSDYFDQDANNEATVHDMVDFLPAHYVMIFHIAPPVNIIAHESFHCVAQHFRYIGQPLDENSEESYAYMLDWLTSVIIKTLSIYDRSAKRENPSLSR